uniref:protein rolling stone-like n=1 Tax=Styela clava TaxID=7725 RepID=UPI00193A8774|nr:protein rolling stone-like [Styela clava]
MATSCGYEFKLKHFGFDDCTKREFYLSQWGRSKIIFIVYRIILFLYWTGWVIFGTIEYSGHERGWAYYVFLSHWDEWLMVFNFGISLSVAIYGYSQLDEHDSGGLRWFHKLSWATRSVSTTVAYVVTILFWALVKTTAKASTAVNIHRHALNAVFVTVDLFVSRVPVRLLHFVYPMLIGITYVLFTYIIHAADVMSSFYRNALDWEKVPVTSIVLCILAVLVAVPLLHSLTFGMYHLRAFIARRIATSSQIKELTGTSNQAFETEVI